MYHCHPNHMKSKSNSGFSFVEILVALAIASLIMASVVSLVRTQSRIKVSHEQIVEVQQNIRSAMYVMERELKLAGYKGNTSQAFLPASLGFVSPCNATTLTFNYMADWDGVDNDSDDDTDEEGEMTTVQYRLGDGDGDGVADDLIRSQDGVNDTIAENIQSIEFFYTLSDDNTASSPADLTMIRSVQVSALAKSRKTVPVKTGGMVYPTPAGDNWGGVDDGLYRRYATSNVRCRNL